MPEYELTWITPDLAVGYAPMSYAELESIESQGIDAIVNLCAEFCDLHEIEEKTGFEVYYLPIWDESAPDMEEIEKALVWLDEAIYLGKKVLVHCRHGIGRTGTFVTSYLLRRGLGLKLAKKKMEHSRACATSFSQWRLLKKYGKKSGTLKIREPSLESRNVVDLSPYFNEYEALVHEIDTQLEKSRETSRKPLRCGLETTECCFEYFDMELIEVVYISNKMNKVLTSDVRSDVIHNAVVTSKKTKAIERLLGKEKDKYQASHKSLKRAYRGEKILCPLNRESVCELYEYRPLRCRTHGVPDHLVDSHLIEKTLSNLSQNLFLAFAGCFLEKGVLSFTMSDAISGKFVQEYFHLLIYLADQTQIPLEGEPAR
jgi:hypothetical protein